LPTAVNADLSVIAVSLFNLIWYDSHTKVNKRDCMKNKRCFWAGDNPLMIEYHDREWGRPSYDDRHLFELLTLEGAQAGLSWETVLNKRENYRKAFHNFDMEKIAKYNSKDVSRLMNNLGIIRNRLKIESTISNAKIALKIQKEYGSLAKYLWGLIGGKPLPKIKNLTRKNLPARTKESDEMSKILKKRGFRFVGSTICYAFMQAVGMVNDHTVECELRGKI
jgi:DNA-3-methyladenine glycosylase I